MEKNPDRESVSVVIPFYEDHASILDAVRSVDEQTQAPSEILIIDDCSPEPLRIAVFPEPLRESLRIVRLQENCGPATARNTGWDLASGDWVAFLDADDAWLPWKLEVQLLEARESKLDIIGGGTVQFDEPVGLPVAPSVEPVTMRQLLWRNSLATRTVMVRRVRGERFPDGRRHSEDFHLWLELIGSGARGGVITVPVAVTRRRSGTPGGLSGNLVAMQRGELRALSNAYRKGYIGTIAFALATLWSAIRFGRRLIQRTPILARRSRG